jgi:hypothetical protein
MLELRRWWLFDNTYLKPLWDIKYNNFQVAINKLYHQNYKLCLERSTQNAGNVIKYINVCYYKALIKNEYEGYRKR